MYCPIKTADALVDQANATSNTPISTRVEKAPSGSTLNKSTTTAARVIGKTQYPSTHTDWKKEIVPPKSCALMVTTADPSQTAEKTAAKTKLACPTGAFSDNRTANPRQTTKGPHKSQSLRLSMICLSLSVRSMLSDWDTPEYPPYGSERSMGRSTTLSLLATERTSRMMVSLTGSSRVETGAKKSFSCWSAADAPIGNWGFAICCCCSCWAGRPVGLAH
mmetsp:Transcript_30180/g.64703  ORF Transcript_30180/g.64703 Transcript_30180/m.64703 type:complete len:220 (+) Transcript_30180:926-1585(+)